MAPRTLAWRPLLAVLLMAVLMLAGIGRAVEDAHAAEQAFSPIPGFVVPICHSVPGGESGPADPAAPVHHECCDACALGMAMAVPTAPDFGAPAPLEHFAEHAAALTWEPIVARPRSPRQSRAPPAA